MTAPQLTARNASAQDMVELLQSQQAAKLDVVAPATKIKSSQGLIVVDRTVAHMDADGVTSAAGSFRPTEVFDEGLASKLGIPRDYLRKMRDGGRTDLIDGNVNGWLHGRKRVTPVRGWKPGDTTEKQTEIIHPADDRSFLLRLFRGGDGEPGVARAMVSDKYNLSMDNLDVLTAVMKGIQAAGVQPQVHVSDLSERRMRVRFEFPDVNTTLPGVLADYRSPFRGGRITRAGHRDLEALRARFGEHHIFADADAPVIYMGIDLDNSETGGGAFNLVPVALVVKCTNGWVFTEHGMRKVHLGARLAEGLVQPSLDTIQKAGHLVTAETRDAVNGWLADGTLTRLAGEVAEKAGHEIGKASEVVPRIVAGLGFSKDEQQGVLDMFIASGGGSNAGNLLQAVTAYAQTIEDPDRAYEVERAGIPALNAAAAA